MRSSSAAVLDRLLLAVFGFAAGYLVGVLAAPRAGEQTRQRLATGAREAALAAQQQARDATEPLAERVRETASELTDRHVPLASDLDVLDSKTLARDLSRPPRR